MATVIYSPEAESDLLEIAEYIAQDKPIAARNWVAMIRNKCELLATQPKMGELRRVLVCPIAAHLVSGTM